MSHQNSEIDEYIDFNSDSISQSQNKFTADQLKLGITYFQAYHLEDNCLNTFEGIKISAEQGNMEAQFRLADLYSLGQGTSRSHTNAYKWYTKAAIQGYKKASIRIHNLYQEDIKMHCRGKLNSKETLRKIPKHNDSDKIKYQYRELNEQRLDDHKQVLNHAIDYYTSQFKQYKTSNQEDGEVQQNLGFLYQHGYGVKKYHKWAIEYYTKAAEQGYVDSQYQLGCLYQTNTDIRLNYKKAFYWYSSAADGGNISAQSCLAYFYEKGLGTEFDYQNALYWYTKAADSGNSQAQLTLGKWYRKGEYVVRNYSTAVKWYTLAARQGNSVALNCLAQLHQTVKIDTTSLEEDISKYLNDSSRNEMLCSKLRMDILKNNDLSVAEKMKVLAKRALIGDGNAMYEIGLKYYHGIDLIKDEHTAFRWIKNAANTGLGEAMTRAAKMYEEGDTVEQNYYTTATWTKKMARQKSSKSLCDLGILYNEGKGVRNDPLEASKWFTLSSEQGNSEAQYQLGCLRQEGRGLRKNEEEALKLFKLSAEQGNVNGCYAYGKKYFDKGQSELNETLTLKLQDYSANHGNAYAQYQMWKFHNSKSKSKADFYFEKLICSKNAPSINQILINIMDGDFHVDYVNYFSLIKLAADLDVPLAKKILYTPMDVKAESFRNTIQKMFIFVTNKDIISMGYHIGCMYEYRGFIFSDNSIVAKNHTEALYSYFIAAEKGDSRARIRLGVMFEEGEGVDVNFTEAISYYNLAYEKGNKDAMYRLACLYLDGRGVSQDLEKAFELYTQASDMGHIEARKVLMLPYNELDYRSFEYRYYQRLTVKINHDNQIKMLEKVGKAGLVAVQYRLGIFYNNKDDKKAVYWFTLAAQGGITDAYYRLGILYEEGRGIDQDHLKAIILYENAIKNEHGDAMYRLARMYLYGKNTEVNYKKAYQLYCRAAKLGHALSSGLLGFSSKLKNDPSVKHSISERFAYLVDPPSSEFINALLMFQHVAEEGDMEMQYKLGLIYNIGLGKPNYEEAAKWYSMAVDNSHREAMYRLGLLYEAGLGVFQDHEKAVHLYNQAYNLGNYDALYRLGTIYLHDISTAFNPEKVVQCYTKAANNNHLKSQHTIGKLLEEGLLAPKDTLEALRWYTKAYLQGYDPVMSDLYAMYDDLPYEKFFISKLNKILLSVSQSRLFSDVKGYNESYESIQYKLGIQYLYRSFDTQDYTKTFEFLKKSNDEFYNSSFRDIMLLNYNGDRDIFLKLVDMYEALFDNLDPYLQYKLAMTYYNGVLEISENKNSKNFNDMNGQQENILESDYTKAILYFERIKSENYYYKTVQELLAEMYTQGAGVEKSIEKAIEHYTKASISHNQYAFKVAQIYHFNIDFIDYSKAIEWYKKADEYYKSVAFNILGIIYKSGNDIKQDYNEARHYFIESARLENKYAHYNLGLMYYHGQGVESNCTEAYKYFKKASDYGHVKAQTYLANIYKNGYGVERNFEEEKKWYLKAYDGTSEDRNIGISDTTAFISYPRAIEWLKKMEENDPVILLSGIDYPDNVNYPHKINHFDTADYPDGDVCTNDDNSSKGNNSSNGDRCSDNNNKNIAHDHKDTHNDFTNSIRTGEGHSAYILGNMYYRGDGVQKNFSQAYVYFLKAAERDNHDAQMMLAEMYKEGNGVDKNIEKVIEWYTKASEDKPNRYAFDIAFFYATDGDFCDYTKAIEWYLKVEGESKAAALNNIGVIYSDKNQDYEQAIYYYKESAALGDRHASYNLGDLYYYGNGVDQDYKEAYNFFKTAANRNHTNAQVMLAKMYTYGQVVEKSIEKVIECYNKASEGGPNRYAFDIAFFYATDEDFCDFTKAIEWYRKVEDERKADALNIIGFIYNDKNQDYEQAIHYYNESAILGNEYASFNLGRLYYNGEGVDQDYKKAYSLFKTAADQDHTDARMMLAEMYKEGNGVDKNIEKVIEWYTKASEDKPNRYAFDIAFFYATDGDFCDYTKAIEWYLKVEGESKAAALNNIGVIYSDKNQDYEQAIYYYKESAALGDRHASYNLGDLYYYGNGVDQDYKEAYNFFKTVADENDTDAQIMLAEMYLHGHGTNQSISQAIELYTTAANNDTGFSTVVIGELYHHNDQIQDFSKALEWYQKTQGSNTSYALRGIGLLFEYGDGVDQSYEKSIEYYQQSIELGNKGGYYNLALIYYHGRGANQDHKKCFALLNKSVEQELESDCTYVFVRIKSHTSIDNNGENRMYSFEGEAVLYGEVYYQLGMMHKNGQGTDQNYDKANECFIKAIGYGNEQAKEQIS